MRDLNKEKAEFVLSYLQDKIKDSNWYCVRMDDDYFRWLSETKHDFPAIIHMYNLTKANISVGFDVEISQWKLKEIDKRIHGMLDLQLLEERKNS